MKCTFPNISACVTVSHCLSSKMSSGYVTSFRTLFTSYTTAFIMTFNFLQKHAHLLGEKNKSFHRLVPRGCTIGHPQSWRGFPSAAEMVAHHLTIPSHLSSMVSTEVLHVRFTSPACCICSISTLSNLFIWKLLFFALTKIYVWHAEVHTKHNHLKQQFLISIYLCRFRLFF